MISGMALGWDMAIAQAAINLGVPLLAYIPCEMQDCKWSDRWREYYQELLRSAEKVIFTSVGRYEAWKMQARNERMINDSELVIALFDGTEGGTYNAVQYAKKVGKPVKNVWQSWVKYGGLR